MATSTTAASKANDQNGVAYSVTEDDIAELRKEGSVEIKFVDGDSIILSFDDGSY